MAVDGVTAETLPDKITMALMSEEVKKTQRVTERSELMLSCAPRMRNIDRASKETDRDGKNFIHFLNSPPAH